MGVPIHCHYTDPARISIPSWQRGLPCYPLLSVETRAESLLKAIDHPAAPWGVLGYSGVGHHHSRRPPFASSSTRISVVTG